MSFPASPSNNQIAVVSNISYQYSSVRDAWVRLPITSAANITVDTVNTGNIYSSNYYFANGTPFVSSSYGNTEVSAYLDPYFIYANANAASQQTAMDTINANVGAYQIYANATFTTYSNTNVAGYLAGNVTTGNIAAAGYYFANGMPFISGSNYGNTEVSAYLPTYTGNLNPGNITASGNIVGGGVRTTTGSTPPTNPVPGDIWYDTASDLLFRYTDLGTSRRWLDVTGSTGFVNFYDNANVAAYLADTITVGNVTTTGKITGNLVPSANITYSLGEEWLRWKNLYLSGQTIFLGNSIITEDVALGTVTIIPPPTTEIPNPTAVVISSYGTISTANTADGQVVGNVSVTNNTTLSNVTVTGNISTNGAVTTTSIYTNNYFYSNGAPFVPTTGYINLSQTGSITSPYSGTARFYPPKNLTITRVNANLSDSPVGTPLTFIIKKNGTSIGTTFSIPTTSPVMTPVTVSVALTTTDYLTLDITGGSGSDLFVSIAYA